MTTSREWIRLSNEQVEVITKHQKELPVKLGSIAKDFGITVKNASLDSNISGEIKCIDDETIIRVNRHDVRARQRFTLAHELGHFLLHYDLIGDGITDDVLYRSSLSNAMEAEANRLAADIVMPSEQIKAIRDANQGLEDESLFEMLAEAFGVSITAIKIRLGKL